ncbi:MAG TPA: DUF655 domain-containing protein [archaeon]|nr:DUF655 domain-containing protein [archaeon]
MDQAIVLDLVQKGTPLNISSDAERELRNRNIRVSRGGYAAMPLAYVLTKTKLFLALAVPMEGKEPKIGDTIDLNEKTQILAWARIKKNELTSSGVAELENALEKIIDADEKRFVDFFNQAPPITTRMHSLEMMPGVGKKHMWEIIEKRRKPFRSLADIKERIPLILEPKRSLKERIIKELEEDEKYYFFVLPPRRVPDTGRF